MKFTPTIGSQLSGSLDGVTASRNRGGPYFRSRETPVNPNSLRQAAVRQAFAQMAQAWSTTLDQTARDAYIAQAPFVTPATPGASLTGQNCFMMVNQPIQQINEQLGTTVPMSTTAPFEYYQTPSSASPATTLAQTGNVLTVSFADTDLMWDEDYGYLAVYLSPPQGAGVVTYHGQYRLAGVIQGSSSSPPSSPVATMVYPWADGEIQQDKRYFAKYVLGWSDTYYPATYFEGPIPAGA